MNLNKIPLPPSIPLPEQEDTFKYSSKVFRTKPIDSALSVRKPACYKWFCQNLYRIKRPTGLYDFEFMVNAAAFARKSGLTKKEIFNCLAEFMLPFKNQKKFWAAIYKGWEDKK